MNYAVIKKMDITNGEGIRVSLFVSGCKFHCKNCFNLEVQNFSYGEKYTQETVNRIKEYLCKSSVKGLSLLGGDPLWQTNEDMEQLSNLCKEVHNLGKDIWIWSGFTWEDIFDKIPDNTLEAGIINAQQELIAECDVFVDGPFVEELKDLSLAWRGSSNQRVIDVQKTLKAKEIVLYCD